MRIKRAPAAACRWAVVLLIVSIMPVAAGSGWNGTWVGNWDKDNGAQIVFAGDELSGLFWDGDYVSDAHAMLSNDGRIVTITWNSASAVLTRDGNATAHIVIKEKNRPNAAFDLKRDNS